MFRNDKYEKLTLTCARQYNRTLESVEKSIQGLLTSKVKSEEFLSSYQIRDISIRDGRRRYRTTAKAYYEIQDQASCFDNRVDSYCQAAFRILISHSKGEIDSSIFEEFKAKIQDLKLHLKSENDKNKDGLLSRCISDIARILISTCHLKEKHEVIFEDLINAEVLCNWIPFDRAKWGKPKKTHVTLEESSFNIGAGYTIAQIEIPVIHYTSELCLEWYSIYLDPMHERYPGWFQEVSHAVWEKNFWERFLFDIFKMSVSAATKLTLIDIEFLTMDRFIYLVRTRLFDCNMPEQVSFSKLSKAENDAVREISDKMGDIVMHALFKFLPSSPSTSRKYPGLSNFYEHSFLIFNDKNECVLRHSRFRSSVIVPYMMEKNVWEQHTRVNAEQFIERMMILKNGNDNLRCWFGSMLSPLISADLLSCEGPVLEIKRKVIEGLGVGRDYQIKSDLIKMTKTLDLKESNTAINEFRVHKKLSHLAITNKKSLVEHILNLLRTWAKSRVDKAGVKQFYEMISESWDVIKDKPLQYLDANNDKDHDESVHFMIHLALFYIQSNQVSSSIQRSSDYSALMSSAAEELILVSLGYHALNGCRSGKDRRGVALIFQDALLLYYKLIGSFPSAVNFSVSKILLNEIASVIFLSGHHQVIAGENAEGCIGLKSLNGVMPADLCTLISSTSSRVFDHNKFTANLNRPAYTGESYIGRIVLGRSSYHAPSAENATTQIMKWAVKRGLNEDQVKQMLSHNDTEVLLSGPCEDDISLFQQAKLEEKETPGRSETVVDKVIRRYGQYQSSHESSSSSDHRNPNFTLAYEPGDEWNENAVAMPRKKNWFQKLRARNSSSNNKRYSISRNQGLVIQHIQQQAWNNLESFLKARKATINQLESNHTLLSYFLHHLFHSGATDRVSFDQLLKALKIFKSAGASFSKAKTHMPIPLDYVHCMISAYKLFPGKPEKFAELCDILSDDINDRNHSNESFVISIIRKIFIPAIYEKRRESINTQESENNKIDQSIKSIKQFLVILKNKGFDLDTPNSKPTMLNGILSHLKNDIEGCYKSRGADDASSFQLNVNHWFDTLLLIEELMSDFLINIFQNSNQKMCSFDYLAYIWSICRDEKIKQKCRDIFTLAFRVDASNNDNDDDNDVSENDDALQRLVVAREEYLDRCPGFEVTMTSRDGILSTLLTAIRSEEFIFIFLNKLRERLNIDIYEGLFASLSKKLHGRSSGFVCHRYNLDYATYIKISRLFEERSSKHLNLYHYINDESVRFINNYRIYPRLDIKRAFLVAAVLKLPQKTKKSSDQAELTVEKWFCQLNELLSILLTSNDSEKAIELINLFITIIYKDFCATQIGCGRIRGNSSNLENIVTCVRRLAPLSDKREEKYKLLSLSDNSLFKLLRRHLDSSMDEIFSQYYKEYSLSLGSRDDVMTLIQNALLSVNYIDEITALVKQINKSKISPSGLEAGEHTVLTCLIENHYQTISGNFVNLVDNIEKRVASVNVPNGDGKTPADLLLQKVVKLNTSIHWKNILKLVSCGANLIGGHSADVNAVGAKSPLLVKICQHFMRSQNEANNTIFAKIIFTLLSRDEDNDKKVKNLLVEYFKSIDEYEVSKLYKILLSSLDFHSSDSDLHLRLLITIMIDSISPGVIKCFFDYQLQDRLLKYIPQMCQKWGFASGKIIEQAINDKILNFFSRVTIAFFNSDRTPVKRLPYDILPAVFLLYLSLKEYSPSRPLDPYQKNYFTLSIRLANQYEENDIDLGVLTELYSALRGFSAYLSLHDVIRAIEGVLACEKYTIDNFPKFNESLSLIVSTGLARQSHSKAKRGLNQNSRLHGNSKLDEDDGLSPRYDDSVDDSVDDTEVELAQTMVADLAGLQNTLFNVTVSGMNPDNTVDAFNSMERTNNIFTYLPQRYSPDFVKKWLNKDYNKKLDMLLAYELDDLKQILTSAISENRYFDIIACLDAFIIRFLPTMKLRYTQIIVLLGCLVLTDDHKKDGMSSTSDVFAMVKTGQGKSLIIILYSIYSILKYNQSVHIIAANDHLTKRDVDIFSKLLDAIGIPYSHGKLHLDPIHDDSIDDELDKPAIIYTTMRHVATWYFNRLYSVFNGDKLEDIKLVSAVIDEVDLQLYLTNGALYLQLKTLFEGFEALIQATWRMHHQEKHLSEIQKENELLKVIDSMHEDFRDYLVGLIPSLKKSVKVASTKVNGIDYAVDGRDIVLINRTTGQVLRNVRVSFALLQFIALNEGLPIPTTYLRTAALSYHEILKSSYRNLVGFSGSLGLDQERNSILDWREDKAHRTVMFDAPKYHSGKREYIEHTPSIFETEREWFLQSARIAVRESNKGLPIIFIVETEAQVQGIYQILLADHGRTVYDTFKITGLKKDHNTSDTQVNVIVSKAGTICGDVDDDQKVGAITVATRMGARGHDFQVHGNTDAVRKDGLGLLYNWPDDANEEKQIQGRTARQDCPGWGKLILSRPEIERYLAAIKADYGVSPSKEIPWGDSWAVVKMLRELRERVALLKIEERKIEIKRAFIFHQVTLAFFQALSNSSIKKSNIEIRWAIFLSQLYDSSILDQKNRPNNQDDIDKIKSEFKSELESYHGSYDPALLAIHLLLKRFHELQFDLSPNSTLAKIDRNAVSLASSKRPEVVKPDRPILMSRPIVPVLSSSSSTSSRVVPLVRQVSSDAVLPAPPIKKPDSAQQSSFAARRSAVHASLFAQGMPGGHSQGRSPLQPVLGKGKGSGK